MNDYLHFLSMIYHDGMYNGKQIISAETVKEMQADQVKGAIVPSNNSDNYVAKGLGQSQNGIYGLGEWHELIDKKTGEAYQISAPGWAGACLLYTSSKTFSPSIRQLMSNSEENSFNLFSFIV